jgi:anti-sigma factor RsiW
MSCPHAIDVGAYVIDALEPAERAQVTAHLARCDACAAELRELEGLPVLLATVPARETVPSAPVPSELAFLRLRRSAEAASSSPGRQAAGAPPYRRRWLLAAAAAVVVGVGGAGVAVAVGNGAPGPTTVAASSGDLSVRAAIAPSGSGSRITLALDGVPSGQQCELSVQASDGHWETSRAWTADYDGDARIVRAVHIPPDQLRRLVIRSLDGRTLVSMNA